MWNLIQHLADAGFDGTIRLCDGLRRSWSEVFPVQKDPPPATPFTVVTEQGKLRLRYYRPQGQPQPTPVLLVYALVKRPFILDFQPGRSMVETLTRRGFAVYLTDWIPPIPETVMLLTKTYGNCPAWIIHAHFTAMAPVHHALGKYMDLYRQQAKEGYTVTFELFERWMHSDVPLAGQLFQELSNDIFRYNRLMRGPLYVGGLLVSMQHIRCPVFNIVGAYDDVVPPNSSLPLLTLTGSRDAQNHVFPAGHMGLAVSGAAHTNLWPHVGHWLTAHEYASTH